MQSEMDVLVWACILLFLVTIVITIAGLLGFKIGGTKELNEYFLKRLFLSLILAIVGSCVAVFGVYLNGQKIAGVQDTGFATLQGLETRIRELERVVYK
jgi:hypothetical protein